jgi:asparagine synthase (glutamine-hydrolysing)
MCGFFASIGFIPDERRIEVVAHRGPDGQGWRERSSPAGPVALGHRRLAILDTSASGFQPMASADGRHLLVYNGEIYNFLELRSELEADGEHFRTGTDTEVLLRLLMRRGANALQRLRGMFAFALWDDREKSLLVGRDRFGIKPVYFAASERGVAFGSEIKQLRGLGAERGAMNLARVTDFLVSGLADHTDETMFQGVRQLRPGELALVDAADGRPKLEIGRWYELPEAVAELEEAEAAERFRALLTDAVRLHLRSDVAIGSCLSGGLDSSSIVCLMAGLLDAESGGRRVEAVSACYPERSVDEKPFVDVVVGQTKATSHLVWPRAEDLFARIADITWHQDEPFGSTSIFAQWCVFEEARRAGITVMLDGQGADEQLAGYTTGFSYHLADLVRRGDVAGAAGLIASRRRMGQVPVLRQVVELAPRFMPSASMPAVHALRERLFNCDWLGRGAAAAHARRATALDAAARDRGLGHPRGIDELCRVMTFASNLQMLLHWEDRNSMAHGIEARVPFLDHPLVEFSLALGGRHKMRGAQTKSVLRDAMSGIIPDQVRDRRDKLGFATPEAAWFRGPLRPLVIEGVEATLRRYPDLLNPEGVRRRAKAMLDGRRAIDFWLWRVVNLGHWGERFGVAMG